MPAGLKPQEPRSVQFRKWKGANLTDARTAIGDEEFSWLENAVTVGDGAIQIINKQGASIATVTPGIASLWGFTLNLGGTATPVLIAVGTDGSLTQVTLAGAKTVMAVAGTVTISAHLTIWRDSPILVIDPTKGYFSWDGTTWTVIDATKTGPAVAVFEGRAWLANNRRTITYTAPNTNNDFTAGNGAGSTVLTDEAFPGSIVNLVSAIEQLWVIGAGAIDAISNVQATGVSPTVVTTFTVTNIVTNVGSSFNAAAVGYFRALSFLAAFGVYALVGVTPQKLSDKLDGLFPDLTLTTPSMALALVQNLLCLLILVTYTGTKSVQGAGPVPLVLCFTQGKWFFAAQGSGLTWITTVLSTGGLTQAWGTDGSTIYQLFGAASTVAVQYKIEAKLSDFGAATQAKAVTKAGFEFQASNVIAPTVTIDSEVSAAAVTLSFANTLAFTGLAGAAITFQGTADITWVSQGLLLSRATAAQFGRYIGWTVTGTDAPYRLQAVQLEIIPTREWQGTMP